MDEGLQNSMRQLKNCLSERLRSSCMPIILAFPMLLRSYGQSTSALLSGMLESFDIPSKQ
jgi:hypothetical protein